MRKPPTRSADGSCVVCGNEIKVMVHKATPVCSQRCEKLFKKGQAD